jgi:hypothetical protein
MEQRRDHGLDSNPRFAGTEQYLANEHAWHCRRKLDVAMPAKCVN